LVAEAVAAGWELEAVYVGSGSAHQLDDRFGDAPVVELAPGVVERVASTVTPQHVLAVARTRTRELADVAEAGFVVVAAGVADPGNLGTILRVGEAAGADAVVLTRGSAEPFNPKVVRASAGALFHVPIVTEVDVARLSELLPPRWAAAATGGVPYDEAPIDPPVALVLGSESHGVPAGVPVDGTVSIPHAGRAESLNVAMAAAVLCFEVARRVRYRAP
jgi:TrmH family RNA methyltransferase